MKGLSSANWVLLGAIPGAVAAGFSISNRMSLDAVMTGRGPMQPAPMALSEPTPRQHPRSWDAAKGVRQGESEELRALRMDEVEMFPEFTDLVRDPLQTNEEASRRPDFSRSASFGLFDDKKDFLEGLVLPDIAVRRHERVQKYLRYFTSTVKGRGVFVQWLKRSGRYRNIIAEHLSRYDLPQDLASVVFIESGFWPNARSSAGALGMWQFMQKTAGAYGLVVRPDYDERKSIWASTDAAARHLDDLHTRFGNWDLALAAYNAGYGRIEETAEQMGTSDFWELSNIEGALPQETALYVPKILAVAVIDNNLEVFGFADVEQEDPISAEPIDVEPGTRLSLVARAAGTSVRNLKDLNPQISGSTVPDIGGPVSLYVPASGVSRARALLPRLLGGGSEPLDSVVSDDFDWGRDRLNPDGLSALELTGVASADDKAAKEVLPPSALDDVAELGPDAAIVVYEVMAGDTLNEIADAFAVPMRALAQMNSLQNPSHIMIGQRLRLPVKKDDQTGVPVVQELAYRVSRGETLTELANYFGASVEQLSADNRIKDPASLQEGQLIRVRVPAFKPSERAELNADATSGKNSSEPGDAPSESNDDDSAGEDDEHVIDLDAPEEEN